LELYHAQDDTVGGFVEAAESAHVVFKIQVCRFSLA
jgi:hypothetical protein